MHFGIENEEKVCIFEGSCFIAVFSVSDDHKKVILRRPNPCKVLVSVVFCEVFAFSMKLNFSSILAPFWLPFWLQF